jgi:hypothetical protein
MEHVKQRERECKEKKRERKREREREEESKEREKRERDEREKVRREWENMTLVEKDRAKREISSGCGCGCEERERRRAKRERERDRGEKCHVCHGMVVVVVALRFCCKVHHQFTCGQAHAQAHVFPQLPWHAAESCTACAVSTWGAEQEPRRDQFTMSQINHVTNTRSWNPVFDNVN